MAIMNLDLVTEIATRLHNDLLNRDSADCHPISAITGLSDALTNLQIGVSTATSGLTDGSVTKIGTSDIGTDLKPIKLVGGVPTAVANDIVDTASAQVIYGIKMFKDNPAISKGTPSLIFQDLIDVWDTAPSGNRYYGIGLQDKNNTQHAAIGLGHYTNGTKDMYLSNKGQNGTNRELHLAVTSDGTGYLTGPNRAYNRNNSSDIVNIALLQASTDVVHTSGTEVIGGQKQFGLPNNGGYLLSARVASDILGDWIRIARFNSYSLIEFRIYGVTANNGLGYAHFFVGGSDQYNRSYIINTRGIFNGMIFQRIAVSGYNELWIKVVSQKLAGYRLYVTQATIDVLTRITDVYENLGQIQTPAIGDSHPVTSETITGSDVIQ